MTATNLPCCQKRVYMCPLSSSLKMQSCCMSFWLTGSRDFTLAGPHPALISVFFAHFQVEMAVTITTTQTDVAVTLANDRMILLTPTFQQKNVTCTAIFLLSEETIYLCLVVNRFLAVEPPWSRQASSRSVAGLTRRRCSNNAFPLQIKALCLRAGSIQLLHGFGHFKWKFHPMDKLYPKWIANYIRTEHQLVLFLCSFPSVSLSPSSINTTIFMTCRVLLLNYVLCGTKL